MQLGWRTLRTRSDLIAPIMATGAGAGLAGATLSYLFDPQHGARRRAEVRQKALHAANLSCHAAEVSVRDMAHRAEGWIAKARMRLAGHGEPDDDVVIAQRVRSRLGRLCSHPHAIEVDAQGGRVQLKGAVLEQELKQLLRGVAQVPGVREIDDRLEPHISADNVPRLQGGATRPRERSDVLQESWVPATRMLAGAAGAGLVVCGVMRRGVFGVAACAGGLGLLARSATNLSGKRLVGIGAGRRAVEVQKDIHVDAPIADVFDYFRRFENFPKFMSHVREVTPVAKKQWRWSVTGPAGVPVSWVAELNELVPNEVIAWQSVDGSAIRHAGVVRFEPDPAGGTRVKIRLSYNPPLGVVGHALASLLGANPKKQLDDDMLRFKSLLELGKATGRSSTVTREELAATH